MFSLWLVFVIQPPLFCHDLCDTFSSVRKQTVFDIRWPKPIPFITSKRNDIIIIYQINLKFKKRKPEERKRNVIFSMITFFCPSSSKPRLKSLCYRLQNLPCNSCIRHSIEWWSWTLVSTIKYKSYFWIFVACITISFPEEVFQVKTTFVNYLSHQKDSHLYDICWQIWSWCPLRYSWPL